LFKWIHRFGSAPFVYRLAGTLSPWIGMLCLAILLIGLYRGLVVAPADYEQGESYRIIYVHVPAAILSMFVYMVMAVSSAVFLIWRMKLADVVAQAALVGQTHVGHLVDMGWALNLRAFLVIFVFWLYGIARGH